MAKQTEQPVVAEWPAQVMRDLAMHLQRENLPQSAEYLLDAALVFQREVLARQNAAPNKGTGKLRIV